MLEHTFVHIPGIGSKTERGLWERGIETWNDVDGLAANPRDLRPRVRAQLAQCIPASRRALAERNAGFFARLCQIGEAWRLFGTFAQDCVYLDIETTGLSLDHDQITLVGLFDGEAYTVLLAGDNLHTLPGRLRPFSLVCTFNGAGFDLRFLQRAFPQLVLPPIHIDLRWATRRLGFAGGLKVIESALGLTRAPAVQDLTGFDAVLLWRRYLRGDRQALDLLIQYNAEDVRHLQTIMHTAYAALAQKTGLCAVTPPPPPAGMATAVGANAPPTGPSLSS
jgi:uncharacterized protein